MPPTAVLAFGPSVAIVDCECRSCIQAADYRAPERFARQSDFGPVADFVDGPPGAEPVARLARIKTPLRPGCIVIKGWAKFLDPIGGDESKAHHTVRIDNHDVKGDVIEELMRQHQTGDALW